MILICGKFSPFGKRPVGGLQSWIKTVYDEFIRLGHKVEVWEPDDINETQDGKTFDLGIFSNIELTRKALFNCKDSVLVSHGIIDAERPDQSCNRTLFVSEGVRDHWKMAGDIIRQPIDLDFWKPKNNIDSLVTRFSYREGQTHCFWASSELKKTFAHVKNHPHQSCRHFLRKSAVVYATGRAALESMACGAPTVIYDHRDAYQPPLMGQNLHQQMENSYSGRGGFTPSKEKLLSHTKQIMNEGSQRHWVEENHDVKEVVKCLL